MNVQTGRQRQILLATCLSYVIVILDTSIVNVALEPIATRLNASVAGLQWVVNAYTLTFASLLLTGGALGDRLGAKKIYLTGLLLFATASALCGLAPTLPALIVARVLQGVGAALLVPCSLTLLNNVYPDAHERAGAIGKWAGFGGIAMAAGPLIGGVLIHWFGWRCIFWVNVPFALAGAWLTTRVPTEKVTVDPDRHSDGAGQILAIIALASTVAVLISGSTPGWGNSQLLAGSAVAVLAWSLFILTEMRAREPILPLRLFKNRVFSAAVFTSLVSALVFYGLFFLLSLYFQTVRHWPPLQTGLAFLPLTLFVTLGSFTSGPLCRRFGALYLVGGGFLLYAAGFVGLYAMADNAPYWRIVACFPAMGLGAGIITPAATASLMNVINKSQAGVASGVLNASRQTGSAFGVAIFGALMAGNDNFRDSLNIAVSLAIGLSLLAALCWILALKGYARHEVTKPSA